MLKRISAALPAMLLAAPAHAHPGGHDHMAWLEYMEHAASPYHLGLGALVVLLVAVVWLRSRRSPARVTQRRSRRDHR